MRLLTKNTLVLLTVTLIVFLAGGFIFYSQLRNIMNEEATEALSIKKNEVEKYISKNTRLPESISLEELSFTESITPIKESLNDEMIYIEEEKEKMPYKKLSFNVIFEGKNYKCTISKSLLETDDLIETIFQSFAIIIGLLIVVFTIINFLFSKTIWNPFFTTLEQINNYEIEKHSVLTIESNGAKEFQQLNEAIKKMTQKISNDFNNLKYFTENASHELQTPLAIIKSKTEVLLQTEGLNDDQAKQIIEINQTASRLSKLNHTLLLMSKIENNQFNVTENLNFSYLVTNKLKQFEDLIEMKQLNIINSFDNIMVTIHPILADMVVSNLLSNAIKYTVEKGVIKLELTTTCFKISNHGEPLKANGDKLFTRFYKENEDSSSTGLGLALVKQISIINKHKLNYEYINSSHIFTYFFQDLK
ncbi:MAG: HAMP domain-containing sensor histidine kinase [Bacteroidota bacterium]|nr:HAMP domain-containing sensor histidine kinase [Bacteroidota bacterium]